MEEIEALGGGLNRGVSYVLVLCVHGSCSNLRIVIYPVTLKENLRHHPTSHPVHRSQGSL